MAPARAEEDGFEVAIKQVPVTEKRRPFIQKEEDKIFKQSGKASKLPTANRHK
jgi:peroxygenase